MNGHYLFWHKRNWDSMHSNRLTNLPDGDKIVPLCPDDLAAVHELETASQSDPWNIQHFADELENAVASVDLYWHQDELAGFICSWLIDGELQILNLATLPSLRRRGIALHLLEHVITRSHGVGLTSAWLEVRLSNVPAIALYKRFGFTVCGMRSAYYPDGEDGLIMTYDVDPDHQSTGSYSRE
jgi:ribosomal-protein-alanine N-acetyltransferase